MLRRLLVSMVAVLALCSTVLAVQFVNFNAQTEAVNIDVDQLSGQKIELNYQLGGFYHEAVEVDGEMYRLIFLEDESRSWEAGSPDLPRVCRSIIIPDNGLMTARIIASQYRDFEGIAVAPSKGHLSRSIDPATVPFEFGDVYRQDAWYPQNLVELREPYIMRDFRGQVVEVYPFQYNPVTQTLRVYTELTIVVEQTGMGGENVFNRTKSLDTMDREFKKIYQRRFINFSSALDYDPVDEDGTMLIVTYDAFHDAVMPLVEWKNQKGIKTSVVDVSALGSNADNIKGYIVNKYNNEDLTYVLLVGDHQQVPAPMSGGWWPAAQDPTYGQITGNDSYFELFVGRLSAENLDQVNTQVERILDYEMWPQAGAAWYHQGVGLASNQGAGAGHYGESDDEHMDLIRSQLMHYGYTEIDQCYDPYVTSAMIATAFNAGRGIANYCGHGSVDSWVSGDFDNTDVNNLTNANMLPFITSVACNNGTFSSSTCFAETWLRATHNGEPSGAIGFWGSSIGQSWAPPMYAQDEVVDLLTAETKSTYAGLCFNGAMLMIDETGNSGADEADHWTIFGDPSVQVRTDSPFDLSVSHDTQINIGQTSFNVTVSGIEGALAALSVGGNFIGCGYTDASGQAVITIDGPLPAGEDIVVTVTAYNATPYFGTVQVLGSVPDFDLTLTPYGTPIQIPATGGSFDYNVAVTNQAASTQTVHFWMDVTLPSGTTYGPLLGPLAVSLDAGVTIDRDRMQNVPGGAPAGAYQYNAYVGVYGVQEWAIDHFDFEKLSAGDGELVIDWDNSGDAFDIWQIEEGQADMIPAEHVLQGAFPNPFNPSTTIAFQLGQASPTTLQIFNLKGELVETLVDGWRDAGRHEVSFDAARLASGIYLYRLEASGQEFSGKMVLVK